MKTGYFGWRALHQNEVQAQEVVQGEILGQEEELLEKGGEDEKQMSEEAELLHKAQNALQEANKRLLESLVKGRAKEMKITQRGANAALKMCSFEDCVADGGPNEEKIEAVLLAFAKEWPEFAAKSPPPPFAEGTGKSSLQRDVLKDALGLI